MRVLIIAGNALAAEAIRRALRHAPACRVIGYVDGRHPCGTLVEEAKPDVVVVDGMTPGATALSRLRDARAAVPNAKLVLLTDRMEPRWLAAAAAAGADAAISKNGHLGSIGMLVREVAAGNVFHAFRPAPATAPDQAGVTHALTARELEILRLVAAGASNGRIASQLWVTEQTVKFHLSNVYRKLGVANRTEASHYAHVTGLLGWSATAQLAAEAA